MKPQKYIAYYRVSTAGQGQSGLGLDSQQAMVRHFVKGELVAEYKEVASGKNMVKRPELQKAIEHALELEAILIVAKADRLSRNVEDALAIHRRLGEDFLLCCDCPISDRFTITIIFAVAEREALLISLRTKAALKVLKDRGVQLGNPDCDMSAARKSSLATRRANARKENAAMISTVKTLREVGKSWKWIADFLNKPEQPSPPRGGQWKPAQLRLAYIRNNVDYK